ncbi:MAG TPA: NAD-dependent epimerase/dehydratase family protein [Geminicoccus sp.]|uniref:NAD-dependent epimerase/dehydratase family protein n=1 Tax=Geminicoccus sp. TaxID=2024832 RepID=UPI002E308CBF|nr:NAD-dependent epimerase/dehydratase family protein [Geminicoccus sp.]HEX2525823.1 NAD-dependent epimerase/dehydratase family protein [Geminicoccus sp.]
MPQRPPTAYGFVEWFRHGEYDRVQEAVAGMRAAGATYLRTHLSWAEYHVPGGEAWYDWLIPTLGREFDLLPCVHYTPPSLSRTGHSSGPPRRLKDYADFIDHVLTRYGEHFTHVEIWNEPNNLLDWDWREDHDWLLFCEMAGAAAWWIRERGWKPVLCGPSPFDPHWLDLIGQRGLLSLVSAVGFHGFPGTWDSEVASWRGYEAHLQEMREVLDRYNPAAEIWITEAGYATWRHDEAEQVERFRHVMAAPAARVYWYGWQDVPRKVPVQEGVYFDPRHYHLGVTDAEGRPKLLRRLLETQGADALQSLPDQIHSPNVARPAEPVVVIGGAGFIGSNLADELLRDGEEVIVFDSLSRPGVERNLAWLQRSHNSRLHGCIGDIRDASLVGEVVKGAKAVFHLAAQVAVTSSLVDPVHDFAVNAQGTLTVLEALRNHAPTTPLVFASTNKVYGALADIPVAEHGGRYLPSDSSLRAHGVDETRPLDFCTPYGCSKGAADQYVLDYGHSFGLRTAVLRMSCIYGPRQFGTEDQGWVAHFLIKAMKGESITVYGDGKQVRDILHVKDAVAAYRGVLADIDKVGGRAFNLGGGPFNAVSLQAVLAEIGMLIGKDVPFGREDWRTGDQFYFVADTRRLTEAVGWHARIGWRDGLRDLAQWVSEEMGLPLPEEPVRPRRMRA